jgi:hypothetical protein
VRFRCISTVAALLFAHPAFADTASYRGAASAAVSAAANGAAQDTAAVSLDEHFTSNALDSDLMFSDFYEDLRGTFGHVFRGRDGYLRFVAEAQATRYHRISIEDDRSLLLLAEADRKFGGRFELRGTLTWRMASIGDDFRIANLAIGTRTHGDIVAGALQFAADLGGGIALLAQATDTVERYGKAVFQQNLIEATRIEPDRNRLHLSAGIEKTSGAEHLGLDARADLVDVQALGNPPIGHSFDEFALRGVLRLTAADGATLDASIGAAAMDDADGPYRAVRPVYAIAVVKELKNGIVLRGSIAGSFEAVDTNDPLASYVRRLELEAKFQFAPGFAVGIGAFRQNKENLVLENVERSKGFYVELGYDLSRHVTLVARADFSDWRASPPDNRKSTIDTYVGIRGGL